MPNLGEWILYSAAVTAALGVLLVSTVKVVRRLFSWGRVIGTRVQTVTALVERELQHDSGRSMKDDVHGLAVSMGLMQRQQAQLEHELEQHIRLSNMVTSNAVWATERAADVADEAAQLVREVHDEQHESERVAGTHRSGPDKDLGDPGQGRRPGTGPAGPG